MTLNDDEIRAMLAARAGRANVGGSEAAALVAAVRERAAADPRPPRGRFRLRRKIPRIAAGAASLGAAILVIALVAMPLANRPPASTVPNVGLSSVISPSGLSDSPTATLPPAEVRVLTSQELAALVDLRGPELVGLAVAVNGELVAKPSNPCGSFEACPVFPCDGPSGCSTTVISGTTIAVVPVGDVGPGPWDGSGPKTGTFALRLANKGADRSRPLAEYIGDIRRAPDGLTWSVDDLIAGKAREEGGFVAVRGWLVRTPLHSCGSTTNGSGNANAPVFGCPSDEWLTAERFQPLRDYGSSVGPEAGLYLPSGTYDAWAPSPVGFGLGVEPREATYLVSWTAIPPCGPLADCHVGPENFHWLMRGRLDPIPPDDSKKPVEVTSDTDYYPGGIPRSVEGHPVLVGMDTQRRLAEASDDTSFLAGGFAADGPITCSGGIRIEDPNPLGQGCPPYRIAGIPGQLYLPTRRLEVGEVPLVVRVHTHDRGAETCWPEFVEYCRARVIVEAVVWRGDDATTAAPLGPNAAIGRILAIAFAESRKLADGSYSYVDEPLFASPISCRAPWPTLIYEIRGDPRLGLVAVFRDPAARSAFEESVMASAGATCLNSAIDRPDPPRWLGQDNILVLAYADDSTAAEIAAQLAWVEGTQRNTIPLPDASIDRSRETLLDYLDSRAAGPSLTGDVPFLTFSPVPNNPDGNPAIDVSAGWSQDVLRRYEAGALQGTLELITDAPTKVQLGDSASIVASTGAKKVWLYRVTYPTATDPRLATEIFAIGQTPGSTFRDWGLVRIEGYPFPIVPIPARQPASHPFPSGLIEPILP